MKLEYIATNEQGETIKFYAYGEWSCNNTDRPDARNWIINHLDTSKEWTIFNGLWKHQVNFNYHQIDRDEEDTFNQKEYESFEWFWDKEKGKGKENE